MKRVADAEREAIEIFIDGRRVMALRGDTVLTALLVNGPHRAFCLMGACQDCWVATESGDRFRACTTFAEPGMRLVTETP